MPLPRDFIIYRVLGTVEETCEYGDAHQVTYVEQLYVSPNGETREYDNGYTKDQTALVADRSGRIYHQRPPTDYYGSMAYIRDGDKAGFRGSPPSGAVRDIDGPGLQKCPDGPEWRIADDPRLVDPVVAAETALRAIGVEPTPERIDAILAIKTEGPTP